MREIESSDQEPVVKQIGPYRVIRRKSRNNQTELIAKDEVQDRTVAIRLVTHNPDVKAHDRKRFRAKIKAAIKLEHPAILAHYDVVEYGASDCLVMESFTGKTLIDVLRETPLGEAKVVHIVRQLVSAIEKGHQQGFVHANLHTENILLSSEGQVKILNYGIPQHCGSRVKTPRTGQEIRHWSPEQARTEGFDHRTDFFSLGSLIYEMMTRTAPFCGVDLKETKEHIEHRHLTSLSQAIPGIHAKFSVLVDWLLQKDMERRPETAQSLIFPLLEIAEDVTMD